MGSFRDRNALANGKVGREEAGPEKNVPSRIAVDKRRWHGEIRRIEPQMPVGICDLATAIAIGPERDGRVQ